MLKKLLVVSLFMFTLFCGYLYLAGSVSKEITAGDKVAIEKLMVEKECSNTTDYEAEIVCIRTVQSSIKRLVPNTTCALPGTTIEPEQFIIRQYGCCYDRARFTEKALNYYGYETRHVALYDLDRYGILGLFIPGIDSHATTEVKTKRGWMGVDSNHPFLLITTDGKPLTYKTYKDYNGQLADRLTPADFFNRKLFVIYGLYSRHGKFHGLNLPGPEFNINEFVFNFD